MTDRFAWRHVSRQVAPRKYGRVEILERIQWTRRKRDTLFLSCPHLLERSSHGNLVIVSRTQPRSAKRAGVKVKEPTIIAECHRIVNESAFQGNQRVMSYCQQLRLRPAFAAYRMTLLPWEKNTYDLERYSNDHVEKKI